MLLSEDREERNWDKADDNYKDVQQFIIKAEQLELYDDVERLIPDNIKPECIEMTMDIEEYVREDPNLKKGLKTAKRVRNDDAMRNIPTGASTSFVSVKDLLQKAKRKKATQFDENAGEDDSDDQQITAGITANYRRTLSMPDSTSQTKKKLRRNATAPKSSSKARTTKKQLPDLKPSPKDFDEANSDDSDDEAINRGLFTTAKAVMNDTSRSRKTTKRSVASRMPSDSPPHTPPRTKQQVVSIEISSSPDQALSGQFVDEDDHDGDEDNEGISARSRPQDLGDVSVIDLTTPAQQTGSPELRWSSPEPVVDEIPSGEYLV